MKAIYLYGLCLFTVQAAEPPPAALALSEGTVKFVATTNLSAVSVHGQSTEVAGRASLRREGAGLWLENLEAKVDPKTVNTGMSIRDQHMHGKIFATGDTLPALRFVSARSNCSADGAKDNTCQLTGDLTLRGVTKPWTLTLRVRPDGGGYRAAGKGAVKLSAFQVETPCQLGVCVNDEVKLEFDLHVRAGHETSSLTGGAK